MSPRYEPRRIADNSGVPWRTTPGGLRVVDLADVTPKPEEPVDDLDAKGYPILDAYVANESQWAIWCRYCCCWHYHGKSAGHRAEHCHKEDSPYMKTGYILRPIGKPIPRYKNGKPRPLEQEDGEG